MLFQPFFKFNFQNFRGIYEQRNLFETLPAALDEGHSQSKQESLHWLEHGLKPRAMPSRHGLHPLESRFHSVTSSWFLQ